MKCQNCGEELPTYPRDAVEEDEIDEVVAHIRDGDESYAVAQTDYYCDLECAAKAQEDTKYEWEVSVTANVEHTPRVDADSVDEAESVARDQIEEEYGVTADSVRHEAELSDGRHQVCVWAERHLYTTTVQATKSNAIEAGKESIQREHDVQTSDIRGASARKIRKIEPGDGGDV